MTIDDHKVQFRIPYFPQDNHHQFCKIKPEQCYIQQTYSYLRTGCLLEVVVKDFIDPVKYDE